MGKIIKIGISKNKGEKLLSLSSIIAVKGKGLTDDRKFKDNNDKMNQLTLIESENISFFNKIANTDIPQLDFRRNLVTENVKLNNLVNKEFFIGTIKVKAHDLCRPCKYLEKKLNQINLVKELITKAGLRCEILTTGKISVGDIIKQND